MDGLGFRVGGGVGLIWTWPDVLLLVGLAQVRVGTKSSDSPPNGRCRDYGSSGKLILTTP